MISKRVLWLYLPIIAVLLLAFGLRMWHLNTESIWHDEGWSIRAFRGPFTTPDDNTPHLYYLAGHLLWRAGVGESPLALRYVSVLIGTITVAFGLRLGGRWYGRAAGLAFGLLLSFAPLLWEYSQEVRAYVAVPLLALALLAGADALLRHLPGERIPRRVWGFVFLAQLAGLYTHNLAVPLVVWLNAALGLAWLLRRQWRAMFVWAGLQVALLLAYLPWLLTQSPSGTPLNTPPQPGLNLLREIWYSYFLPVLPQLQAAGQPALLSLLLLLLGLSMVLALASGLSAPARAGHRGYLLVSHALLVPAFSTALMLAANIDFHPRYYIAALPGTLLLFFTLPRFGFRRGRLRHVYMALVLVLCGLAAIQSLHEITTTREYQHDDFGALAAYYATLPPEAVILIPFNAERALQDYYKQALDIQAQFVNVPLYSDEAALLPLLQALSADGPRHVELLTWFQLPADPRGMYPCLLAAFSPAEMPSQTRTFFGLSTQAYVLEAPAAAPQVQVISAQPTYGQMTLQEALVFGNSGNNGGAVCLRMHWQLAQASPENLRSAAALLNPFGTPISRAEAEIARPDNVGTAHWQPGESGQSYHLLALPAGAPPLRYDLSFTLYSASQPSGFDLLDAAGNPAGKAYLVRGAVQAGGDGPGFQQTRLQSDNAPDARLETGLPLELTLELARDLTPPVEVALMGAGWQAAQNAAFTGLSWHRFVVPPGHDGPFDLLVAGEHLRQYQVVDVARVFTPPDDAAALAVGWRFPDLATLTAAILPGSIPTGQDTEVTLIWQAQATPDRAYTVFVQLISEDGALLAQSDSVPAGGARPTTGWLAGEYICDAHTLRFNERGRGYAGAAYVITGFYDAAAGFQRVPDAQGGDYARLPVMLQLSANGH